MVEPHFDFGDRLLFRDYLIDHPTIAAEYGNLKLKLAETHRNDRVAYTQAKTEFIERITKQARQYYGKVTPDDA